MKTKNRLLIPLTKLKIDPH